MNRDSNSISCELYIFGRVDLGLLKISLYDPLNVAIKLGLEKDKRYICCVLVLT